MGKVGDEGRDKMGALSNINRTKWCVRIHEKRSTEVVLQTKCFNLFHSPPISIIRTFFSFLISLVVASNFATTAPTTHNGAFSIPAKHNGNFKHNGPVDLVKAYQKFNEPVSADVANAIHRQKHMRATGSAITTPKQDDSEYSTPVQVGTPVQTLHLSFDAGSSELWVFSTETSSQ